MTDERILVCDDDPDVRAIVALSLEAVGGFHVELAHSGEEALRRFEQSPADLVVLDVMLPDLDGPATLARLRALPKGQRTPVVFLSGCREPEEIGRLSALGAAAVLAKPFDPLELPARVRRVLAGASARGGRS